MICLICKHDEINPNTTTVTLERDTTTLVIKSVPVRICTNCGEKYFESDVTAALLEILNTAVDSDVQVEVRTYPVPQVM